MRGRRVHRDVDDLRIHGTWGPPRTLAVPSETGAPRMVARRLIAVVPAYNEAPTVEGVLTRLYPMVDGLIIVDDGSRDETRAIVTRWIADKPHASFIAFDANRGLSAGYGAAFRFVRAEVAAGRFDAGDLILTVDADGQHDPDDVTALVAALERDGLDGLMARRDFSLYPAYKKAGNWVMSAWATLWSGQRFYDVESGYRVFRAGPLGEATRYYEGYRYSETVELAMILPRLGYKLGNNHLVPVPVYRSNTRMKDVIIDLIAMPCAWWRVMTQRARPAGIRERWAPWLPGIFFALLLATLLLVAVKRIFLGDDSMSVYAHVWFIQDRLWSGHGIPRTIGVLDGGRAVTFPYALVPWLLGALLWPLFHNWGVTLLMVVAAVGTPAAACFARPVMRDPWVMLLFLLNPFYLDGVLAFQFPFLWSAFFFFLFVIALDRRRDGAAGVLLCLCITTHPLAGGIGALCYLAVHFLTEPERRLRFFVIGLIAGLASLPALLLARGTPALAENSLRVIVSSIADGFVRRATVLAFPFLATALVVYVRRWYRPIFAVWIAGLTFTLFIVNGAFGYAQGGYGGLFRQSHDIYAPYFASDQFDAHATYRVMEPNQYEDGQYYFLRHGARLANEFFSESMFRRSWTEGEYRDFLATKQIDYVSIERGYLAQYHTNEQQLLDSLTQRDLAHAVYRDPAQRYVVYDVRPARVADRSSPPGPLSIAHRSGYVGIPFGDGEGENQMWYADPHTVLISRSPPLSIAAQNLSVSWLLGRWRGAGGEDSMPRHMTVRSRSRRAPSHGLLTPKARFGWVMALIVLAPLAYGCYAARTPSSQLFGDIYTHGPRTEKVVALTFDDGPNDPYTGQILDVLKQESIHATFFCVGMNAEREPATVRRIAAEGNEVGNHSYRHQKRDTLLDLNYGDAVRTNDILRGITGTLPRLYRAPNGFHTPWSLRTVAEHGLRAIGWDVESNDWAEPGVNNIVMRTVDRVQPGSIILLHDGDNARLGTDRSQQAEAVRTIIQTLKGRGYRFVTVSEMLGLPPAKGN